MLKKYTAVTILSTLIFTTGCLAGWRLAGWTDCDRTIAQLDWTRDRLIEHGLDTEASTVEAHIRRLRECRCNCTGSTRRENAGTARTESQSSDKTQPGKRGNDNSTSPHRR